MKRCLTCNRTYADDTLAFCLEDGSILSAPYDPSAKQLDPQATQILPSRAARQAPAGPSRKVAVTDHSPGYSTKAVARDDVEFGAGKGADTRWLLLLLPISAVVLITLLVGGIWLFTIVKGGSKRRWLTMLGHGQVDAATVVHEASAELASNPGNALALRARSGAYYISNESDQGKRDAEEVERLLVSAASAEEYEARCYARWRLGKPDLAISDCTRAIEIDPRWVWPYHNRANAYNDKRNYSSALTDWNKAIDLDSKFAPAYNNRGGYYTNNRDYDRAITDFSKAIEIDPKFATAYSGRGNAYTYKRDYDKALLDYNKTLELDPRDSRAYNYRGLVYYNQGDYDRAIAEYNRAIELNPRNAWAYDSRGNAYYYKRQNDRALADYNEAIAVDSMWSWAYQDRANIYYDRKDYDRAIADYDRAIELNPSLAWSYNGRGLSYYYKGNLAQAMNDYNKAIEVDPPEAAPFYLNRGNIYYYKKDYERAIADYSKAIEISPRYALAYGNRANAYQAMGDRVSAAADRQKVEDLKK